MPRRRLGVVAFGGFLLLALAAGAATYRRMSLDALVQGSDYVIYGRVIESRPLWDPATRMIWTRTEIRVIDGPKGQAGITLAVTEPGGILDGVGELYPGTPQFRADQEVVLFLYRAPGNRVRVTGLQQGVYAVTIDGQTGERTVTPAAPPPEIVYEEGSPSARTLSQQAPGPEKLSRFLYNIRQKAQTR
ncbi:MAG: hypothetical protein LAP85_01880 [Acidobacteriia bacterium]|nr:hypothetical protein [Terriglobia bacterium]